MTDADIILIMFLSVVLAVVGIAIYSIHTETGDNIAEKIITVQHKYTETHYGITHYYFIDVNENCYQMCGNDSGMRFLLLECNQTYGIATGRNVSCSEKLIEK